LLPQNDLREINTFSREDGTPLHYTLVNIKDWCKNEFEVINQLRINTENSNHRYDVILLINGIPVVQIELKTLGSKPTKSHAANCGLQKRPRQWLHELIALFHAAFYCNQSQ
jgi:type I site-specific restriction-modification system R (restriction) subunit